MKVLYSIAWMMISCASAQAQQQAGGEQQQAAVQQTPTQAQQARLAQQQPLVVDPKPQSLPTIQLEETIRASREQPKVMSIVPWQMPAEKTALPSPIVERIEQNFVPLTRSQFRRQVKHFEQLDTPSATQQD